MPWQWWVSQAIALLALVLMCFTFAQKSFKKISLYIVFGYSLALIGLIFLGNIPAIVASIVALVIEIVSLLEHYGLTIKRLHKYIIGASLFVLSMVFYIIFFEGFIEIVVISYSCVNIIAFLQPSHIRMSNVTVMEETIGILHYILLLAPVNALIEGVVLVRAIMTSISLNKRKKELKNGTYE